VAKHTIIFVHKQQADEREKNDGTGYWGIISLSVYYIFSLILILLSVSVIYIE
jgi:hypothetical protein